MTLLNRVSQWLGTGPGQWHSARIAAEMQMIESVAPQSPASMYRMLKGYYYSNGLYDALTRGMRLRGIATEAIKPLRNPTFRVVEYYVSHVWPGTLPGALPIQTENPALEEAVWQVWKWSNWSKRKQLAVRQLAVTGDLFIKVVQTADSQQVYFQLIDAEYVIDPLVKDHRDFVTFIRVDTPQMDGDGRPWTHTEVWSKETQELRIYRHAQGDTPIERLGEPAEIITFSSLGIDFVPFVHVAFRDVGQDRGMAAITPALDKIDEANRQVTRLHQMLFRYNRPIWALGANALDRSGRPVPPPALDVANGTPLTINDDTMLQLPGMATLEPLIPAVNYEDALAILQDHMGELENDLPELAYYSIRQMGNPSGRALRILLSDAVDRLLEVRGNAEMGLIQANKMALTMAQGAGLLPTLRGTFDAGDFEHTFAERDVIAMDGLEESQEELQRAQAYKTWREGGLPEAEALKRLGYSGDEVTEVLALMTAEAESESTAEAIPTVAR